MKIFKKFKKVHWVLIVLAVLFLIGITDEDTSKKTNTSKKTIESEVTTTSKKKEEVTTTKAEQSFDAPSMSQVGGNVYKFNGKDYTIIEVDGGNKSGSRQSNVAVDIGFGDRVYWGLTNEFGQLVYVIADKVILQNDDTEPVKNGRYYSDEAAVPGTERSDLDQGHVIADSLGGVSNAYNITPQESTLNRHGDQAYMEEVIRTAGGCESFFATITYPDTSTQIPSMYKYEYILKGNKIVDEFPNASPEKSTTAATVATTQKVTVAPTVATTAIPATAGGDVSSVDTDNNGMVTIKEAKDAGFSMPIDSTHWLYKYMRDNDGDGLVGE